MTLTVTREKAVALKEQAEDMLLNKLDPIMLQEVCKIIVECNKIIKGDMRKKKAPVKTHNDWLKENIIYGYQS